MEKTPSESEAEMIVRMFPTHANPAGNVFGGEILRQIDLVAGLVAQRHCRGNAVTASIDRVNFLRPVYVGNALVLDARLTCVRNSSMEVEVSVEAEDLARGARTPTGTALVTLVGLDGSGRPVHVPKLVPVTDQEKRKFREGLARMESRKRERLAGG